VFRGLSFIWIGKSYQGVELYPADYRHRCVSFY
jgi:hypothetical protein